jgi:hypothetical protein
MDDSERVFETSCKAGQSRVVRSFAGSRIEQQIITQAFEIAWHVAVARRRIGSSGESPESRAALAGMVNAQREGAAS